MWCNFTSVCWFGTCITEYTGVATLHLCLLSLWHWFYQRCYSGSRPFMTTLLLLLSSTCLPIRSSVVRFSFCLILRLTMFRVRVCTAPFLIYGLPISTLDCKPLLRCPSCWFSSLFHHYSLCCSKQLAVFSVPPSAKKTGVSFSFSWVTMFGRRIIEPAVRRIAGSLSLSLGFGIFWTV